MSTFSAQVNSWVTQTKERLEAVRNIAVQITFNQVLDSWPTDTGFSKNSFNVNTSGFAALKTNPYPSQKAQGKPPIINEAVDYQFVLLGADLEDTIYGSFSANYAIHIETDLGLVRLAAQNWQENVNAAVQQVRQASSS